MPTHSYVIRRFGLASLARWGFTAGVLVACLPAFTCSALFFSITSEVYRIVGGWHDIGLTILGQRLSLDFIQLLQLDQFADGLKTIQAFGVVGILLLAVVIAAAMGIIVALSFALLGALYNFSGRLKIELVDESIS